MISPRSDAGAADRDDELPALIPLYRPSDKLRQPQKSAFVENLRLTGNLREACRAAGIHRDTYYGWGEQDEEFVRCCQVAREEATELLEQEARRRAFAGVERQKSYWYCGQYIGCDVVVEYSDTLLVFLLKALKPEKYKERVEVSSPPIVKAYQGVDVDRV